MGETLITELLRYCKTTYGIDLSRTEQRAGSALCGDLYAEVPGGPGAWPRCNGGAHSLVTVMWVRGQPTTFVRYRFVGYRQKTLHGRFGVITLVRAYYAPLGSSGKGWVPLAERLGMTGGYTPGCQYFMARFSAQQPYEASLEQFHEVFRADERELISMQKAFEMVRKVGSGLQEQRHQEIRERADKPLAVREEISATMAVSIDAGKVPIRTNEQVTKDGKKKYERAYRDSKVATVSAVAVDKEGAAHCTNTSCVTGIEHADEFFPRIEVEMSRRSHRVAALVLVILGDGASWIWARAADLAESGQKVWYILDFWHACDHLAKISKTLYGEATEQFSTCYERWRSLLWQGCVAGGHQGTQGAAHASGRYTDKQCYDIQGEINYFTENKERMDYPLYRSVPLPIGSGVVESALQKRGRCAHEAERHDVDAGRGQGHAPAPCIREEPPLLERLREPAPFIATTADRPNPPGGCLTATTLSECTPSDPCR